VAVCWTLAFARAAGAELPSWVPVLVALVVWAVYVADRLLDARGDLARGCTRRLRERHLFHWRHRRWLAPLAGAAALTAGWILWQRVPPAVRHRDTLLAAMTLAYFTHVHRPQALARPKPTVRGFSRRVSKELLVGLLFTAGCLLPAWSRAAAPLPQLGVPAVAYALLAWLNCALIDLWERPATPLGQGWQPALWLAAAAAATALFLAPPQALLLAAAALSALLLAWLDRIRIHPLSVRALADAALLVPLLTMGWRR
jgi:hypothetical protein